MVKQGFAPGRCVIKNGSGYSLACRGTLKYVNSKPMRLIKSIHLSRPENYLSIYQSGCNFDCKKCHSHDFTQHKTGLWYSPSDILEIVKNYEKDITLWEPRNKATMFHAQDTCRCCGSCVMYGYKSPLCPGILKPQQIVLSPQGFGPARNIVAFTGGDLMCKPDFYVKCAELIKSKTKQWLLLETNGYGLTPENLDLYCKAGVDSYWLDIKAYDEDVHKWLTGCTNKWILNLPYEIVKRGFVLEVLTLFIPGVVETKQIQKIAEIVAKVNKEIPFSILAFFPQYNMKNYRPPTTAEMILAYKAIKDAGLKNIRVGNIGVFVKTQKDFDDLFNAIGREGL